MNLESALHLSERLWALALFLQALEFWQLRKELKIPVLLAAIQLLCCIFLFAGLQLYLVPILLLIHLLRLRSLGGIFNGGSDYMTSSIGLGLCICIFQPALGLGYIGITYLASYFLAGIGKVKATSWRKGSALKQFLADYPIATPDLLPNFVNFKSMNYLVLLWELASPLALLRADLAMGFLASAFCFHLLNFYVFGLNRFVWAWLAAYPSFLFLQSWMQNAHLH